MAGTPSGRNGQRTQSSMWRQILHLMNFISSSKCRHSSLHHTRPASVPRSYLVPAETPQSGRLHSPAQPRTFPNGAEAGGHGSTLACGLAPVCRGPEAPRAATAVLRALAGSCSGCSRQSSWEPREGDQVFRLLVGQLSWHHLPRAGWGKGLSIGKREPPFSRSLSRSLKHPLHCPVWALGMLVPAASEQPDSS